LNNLAGPEPGIGHYRGKNKSGNKAKEKKRGDRGQKYPVNGLAGGDPVYHANKEILPHIRAPVNKTAIYLIEVSLNPYQKIISAKFFQDVIPVRFKPRIKSKKGKLISLFTVFFMYNLDTVYKNGVLLT